MNWPVFGKAFLCETLYSIPFFILALFPPAAFSFEKYYFSDFPRTAVSVILLLISG